MGIFCTVCVCLVGCGTAGSNVTNNIQVSNLITRIKPLFGLIFVISAVPLVFILPTSDAACTEPWLCQNKYFTTSRQFWRTYWGLTEVPTDIPAEALVVRLHINSITSVPAGVFSHLSQCIWLGMEINEISFIDSQAFTGLVSLKILYLMSNEISVLSPEVFTALSNLDELNLNGNRVKLPGLFVTLHNLRELDLERNQISVLQPGVFTGLNNLTELDLSNNQISVIQAGIFKGLWFVQESHHRNSRRGIWGLLFPQDF